MAKVGGLQRQEMIHERGLSFFFISQGMNNNVTMSGKRQFGMGRVETNMSFLLSPKLNQFHTEYTTTQPTHKFFWSQMNDMAKIRLFYSGAMALILPQFKDITNFFLSLYVLFAFADYLNSLSVCLSVYDCLMFFESLGQDISI